MRESTPPLKGYVYPLSLPFREDIMDINNVFLTSLRNLSKQHTEETLGDRRSYLGASDIGQCSRKVVLERISPKEHDLTTLLRFERGHMAEEIVAKVFTTAGFTNFKRQVEIKVNSEDVPFPGTH
jgi:CRISPR-associated exonuclease Cas4